MRVSGVIGGALVLLLQVSDASATAYSCKGTVDQVTTDGGGNVNASFTFQASYGGYGNGSMAFETVCNVTAVVNGVPTAACKNILATLLAAKLSQRVVEMWFDNANPTCGAPSWGSLKDPAMGWYWGPSLQ